MALRIEKLTLTDFRAFPGPAPAEFVFGGKNVLIYGENGSGKSSLFHALKNFFSFSPQALKPLKNQFSQIPFEPNKPYVEVHFKDDAFPAPWKETYHPCIHLDHTKPSNQKQDSRVREAALRSACLDYRALLDTNYGQGKGAINLFDIAVNRLLEGFTVSQDGKGITIPQLWKRVQDASKFQPGTGKKDALNLQTCNAACIAFNTAFNQALITLHPELVVLLHALLGNDLKVTPFTAVSVTYNQNARLKTDRKLDGLDLKIDLSFKSLQFQQHVHLVAQDFLNEARLSALAIAIYLAGRLACVPRGDVDALKLLVLDDVLVGLDHSNRIPVLDVLTQHFADWQIVLLTHDRNWYELAQTRLPSNDWTCYELYEADKGGLSASPTALPSLPVIRATELKPPKVLLNKAVDLLMQGYPEAAANYTRQACEFGLRAACEVKAIHLPYKRNPKDHQMQDLLDALKTWPIKNKRATKAEWDGALSQLEQFKNIVLNPYSHPSAPNIPSSEIRNSIDAVNHFLEIVKK